MKPTNQYKIGSKTATALVLSSMIGTGVFTSLGYQLSDITNTWSIILLWFIGGFIALIGAFTYAELGTHFKESGGDYIFLSRIFHPIWGYLYAWTSMTVGFSAPIAIAALAMAEYLTLPFGLGMYGKFIGIGIILILSTIHSFNLRVSGSFQDYSSLFKVLFVILLIVIGIIVSPQVAGSINLNNEWTHEIWKPGFAVSLVYVSYAYQGWNQAAYITEEIQNPKKQLPIALIGGTLIVTVIYVALQLVMLKHANINQLAGEADVTTISFSNILGSQAIMWISLCIAIQLIATMSSYIWVGSRLIKAMASEHPLWRPLAKVSKMDIPIRAIWWQTIISVALTLLVSLEQVMLYAGFLLQMMSTVTIFASFYIKPKEGSFRSPFGRVLQCIYILFSLFVLCYLLYERPLESILGLTLIGLGVITYFIRPSLNRTS